MQLFEGVINVSICEAFRDHLLTPVRISQVLFPNLTNMEPENVRIVFLFAEILEWTSASIGLSFRGCSKIFKKPYTPEIKHGYTLPRHVCKDIPFPNQI